MHAQTRLHALDAVRAFALLAGIVLHATMSYFIFIPAKDVSPSTTLGVAFYVIHMFRMSAFYLIAGFFAHMMVERRGVRAFVKDRSKRILAPLVGGWLVFAPPTIAITIWGITRSFGSEALAAGESARAGSMAFPLTHLWFLYYLCLFYAATLALRAAVERIDPAGRLRSAADLGVRVLLDARIAPFVLGVPLAVVLYNDATWSAWFGVPTPDAGLMPKVPALVGFGTAFAFGWLLHRQMGLLERWRQAWPLNLGLALLLTVGCLAIVGIAPDIEHARVVGTAPWHRLAYAAAYTSAIWFYTAGLVGAALRFFAAESRVRRYLADSSYWLYLAHLPVVFFLQVATANVPLHWTIKFPLLLGVTLAVLLASYHYLVRPTFIGAILNGRKIPRDRGTKAAAPPPRLALREADSPAPAAELAHATKRFGTTLALDDLCLTVEPGELLALLGPNGAGKTTAISLWLGLNEPDSGAARLLGRSPVDVEARRDVGVMLQEVSFAPELKARELVELTASYYPNPLGVDEVIALTGTAALAEKRYKQLSGGQKRQVQFAAAVCGGPKLLFLDEPTVGLDVEARAAMWRTIRALLADGTSIVLTTHYLEEAEALADRVAVIAKGRLVALGTVDEMRSLVARRRISCSTTTEIGDIRHWRGVVDVSRHEGKVEITAFDAEAVVRRLLDADGALTNLQVQQATLNEAFTELTKEAA